MIPHGQSWVDRKHLDNSKPDIAHTFICAICRGYKSVIGRKLLSGTARIKKYRCAVCVQAGKV